MSEQGIIFFRNDGKQHGITSRREKVSVITEKQLTFDLAVVGGGIAGLEAARRLLRLGYCPIIVERQDRLGGHVATWHCLFPDMSPAQETSP